MDVKIRRSEPSDARAIKEIFECEAAYSGTLQLPYPLETVIDLADNWLNLKRIELTVFIDNDPAVNLYKKFGFEIEGEAQAFAFRNGEYISAYYMARIAKDT